MKGYIYTINFNDHLYVGKTIHLQNRCSQHNTELKRMNNINLYRTCRESGIKKIELNVIKMLEIDIDNEIFNKMLNELERHYIFTLKPDLNYMHVKIKPVGYIGKPRELNVKDVKTHYKNNSFEIQRKRVFTRLAKGMTVRKKTLDKYSIVVNSINNT